MTVRSKLDDTPIVKALAKVGLVIAGYVAAFAIASAIVALYVTATSGPDRLTYGGMYAFGDSLLFLAVFGIAAIPATGGGFYFLRPYRSFWIILSAIALVLALTALAALLVYLAPRTGAFHSVMLVWTGVAVLRILLAPLFALAFLLAGLLAPNRSFRITLLVAMVIEVTVFSCVALTWFCRAH